MPRNHAFSPRVAPKIEDCSDEELLDYTSKLKRTYAAGEASSQTRSTAFAVVREAAWRVMSQRHYDTQILGGFCLSSLKCVEMATGEGKTLTTLLSVYDSICRGKKAFVVTVNDYLARRDKTVNGQVFNFLGVSVGLIQAGMNEAERREQYKNDVVYVTNQELGFDYLRDHLTLEQSGIVLGENWEDRYCLVDEADSVFIDEARTPLIISDSVPAKADKYEKAKILADNLVSGIHYDVDQKKKNVVLTEDGYADAERALGVSSLFTIEDGGSWASYVTNSVKAKELFKADVDYSVLDSPARVNIIDPFSGRILDGRKYADGLHQAIEAKEGIQVSSQSKVIAKVTYQSFFKMFDNLAAMTGTAKSSASELSKIYGLDVVQVPTALPLVRRDFPDVVFKTRKASDDALVKEVVNVSPRPCLIGTTSVNQSERIQERLTEQGIKVEILNAEPKNAMRESEIVAQAGRLGAVTVATNMAGRGTDIKLGGDASAMAAIYCRSILVGSGVVSPDEVDKLPPSPPESYYPCEIPAGVLKPFPEISKAIGAANGNKPLTALDVEELLVVACDTTEDDEDPDHVVSLRETFESVREAFGQVLDDEKKQVIDKGGLYVMGTNRHDSSRIDRQLRGRAGRQGDPGSSRFFLSFQDDMLTVFGGDQMTKILELFRVSDDVPIESSQVSSTLGKLHDEGREIEADESPPTFNAATTTLHCSLFFLLTDPLCLVSFFSPIFLSQIKFKPRSRKITRRFAQTSCHSMKSLTSSERLFTRGEWSCSIPLISLRWYSRWQAKWFPTLWTAQGRAERSSGRPPSSFRSSSPRSLV